MAGSSFGYANEERLTETVLIGSALLSSLHKEPSDKK